MVEIVDESGSAVKLMDVEKAVFHEPTKEAAP